MEDTSKRLENFKVLPEGQPPVGPQNDLFGAWKLSLMVASLQHKNVKNIMFYSMTFQWVI